MTVHGVTILGPTNLASEVPRHASQMYAKNIVTFLRHLIKDQQLQLDLSDPITLETLLTRDGQVVNSRLREPPAAGTVGGSWIGALRAGGRIRIVVELAVSSDTLKSMPYDTEVSTFQGAAYHRRPPATKPGHRTIKRPRIAMPESMIKPSYADQSRRGLHQTSRRVCFVGLALVLCGLCPHAGRVVWAQQAGVPEVESVTEIAFPEAEQELLAPASDWDRRETLLASLTIFVLAVFLGFELITKVPPTLHTPLMSGSNAISGITLVGACWSSVSRRRVG